MASSSSSATWRMGPSRRSIARCSSGRASPPDYDRAVAKRNWIQEERRKTLGDWVAFCLNCGFVQRYFEDSEGGLPVACPQCAGELRSRCPVPGCKNPAAPVFGMVCAKHKDVSKSQIAKYRQARRAKKEKAKVSPKRGSRPRRAPRAAA